MQLRKRVKREKEQSGERKNQPQNKKLYDCQPMNAIKIALAKHTIFVCIRATTTTKAARNVLVRGNKYHQRKFATQTSRVGVCFVARGRVNVYTRRSNHLRMVVDLENVRSQAVVLKFNNLQHRQIPKVFFHSVRSTGSFYFPSDFHLCLLISNAYLSYSLLYQFICEDACVYVCLCVFALENCPNYKNR